LWENVWNKGLSSIEMETKGEGLDYAVPRAPKLRGKKEERKWMITQVVMLPRSCLQLEEPMGSTMVSTGILRVSETEPNRCWL
jgi:hypothetical protein